MKRNIDKIAFVLMLSFAFQSSLAQAESCAETMKKVDFLYNNIVGECRNPDGSPDPLTDCSGLIIRALDRPPTGLEGAWYIWNPTDIESRLGTTSAYWMRADVNFPTLGFDYRSGYILTPVDHVPEGEPKSHIACISPVVFNGDERAERGCGDSPSTPDQEKSCDTIGATGATWKFGQARLAEADVARVCTFNMKRGHDRVTAAQEFVEARRSIQDTFLAKRRPTELRFYHPTETNTQSVLAFFCTDHSSCLGSLANREEYKKIVKKDKNIIWINFPGTPDQPATFKCFAEKV